MKRSKKVGIWLLVSLGHLLVAAVIGCVLRLYALGIDSGLVYGHLIHSHSHTAMMGWVYLAAAVLIYAHFGKENSYRILFGITSAAVWGLTIAFALQGYAFFSILFCTLHLLCSYGFVFRILRDTRAEKSQSLTLMRWALGLMVISTLGIWGIAPAIALYGKRSDLFGASIQFYLHFQFNGFFCFAVLALIFKIWRVQLADKEFRFFLVFGLLSVLLTFALPLSWYYPAAYWHAVQVAGGVLQAAVFLRLFWCLRGRVTVSGSSKVLLVFGGVSLFLKVIFPLFLLYPELMQLSHDVRSITIAYIHLMMLGMITAFLVMIMVHTGVLNGASAFTRWGNILFIIGFVVTESVLFFQGLQIVLGSPAWPWAYGILAIFSFLLPAAVLCWLYGGFLKITERT